MEITIYCVFYTSEKEKIAIFSLSLNELNLYIKNSSLLNKENVLKIVVDSEKDFMYINALRFLFGNNNKAIKIAKNITHIAELETWIKVETGLFEPRETWEYFLCDNNLLKHWLNNELSFIIGRLYEEDSENNGKRYGYNEVNTDSLKLDSKQKCLDTAYDRIWNFPLFFNGYDFFHKNDYFRYRYQYKCHYKIVQVIHKNQIYNINNEWHLKYTHLLNTGPQKGILSNI